MTENREGHTATLLPNGTVLVAGGGINARGTVGAEIYHPNVLIPAPVLFSLSGDGRGAGAIWNAQTGQIASAGNPNYAEPKGSRMKLDSVGWREECWRTECSLRWATVLLIVIHTGFDIVLGGDSSDHKQSRRRPVSCSGGNRVEVQLSSCCARAG